MADSDISGLTGTITSATLAAGDNFVADDVSDSETTKKITAQNLANGLAAIATEWPAVITVALSDESTAITATGEKVEIRNPFDRTFTLDEIKGSLTGACTTGTFTVDVNENGTSVLSTKLTWDATEKTTTTAATAAVISDATIAADAEIQFDVDDVGDSTATGCKVYLSGTVDITS